MKVSSSVPLHKESRKNQGKYRITALFYDILDFPWEQQYKKWRPELVGDLRGTVMEAGVGTGRNLRYYADTVDLTAIDLSPAMLLRASHRISDARCNVRLVNEDACLMSSIPSAQYDWLVSTFLYCVIPDELQHLAIEQFARVLKPGGRFRLLEMIYSKDPAARKRQDFFAPFVEKVYGARFDRDTVRHVENSKQLEITGMRFLKQDVYLLIEGTRRD